MKLIQCSNGHYYDSDRFAECPYCVQNPGVPGVTVPLNQRAPQPPVNAPRPATPGAPQPATPGAPQPVTAQPKPEAETEPSQQWRAPQQPAGNGYWQIAEDDKRTVSYYSRTIGTEPVVGYLIAIEGAYFGEGFKLKTGRNFIGRSPEMDIQLSLDFSVSRRKHAVIIYEPKAKLFIAQPGESRELFYLNDEVVLNNVTMKPYDVISIGETKLLLLPLCGEKFSWDDVKKEK